MSDRQYIVCFQSVVFALPAGFGKRGASGAAGVPEAAATMLEHRNDGSTHRGANRKQGPAYSQELSLRRIRNARKGLLPPMPRLGRDLPHREQLHWNPYNILPDAPLSQARFPLAASRRSIARQLCGDLIVKFVRLRPPSDIRQIGYKF